MALDPVLSGLRGISPSLGVAAIFLSDALLILFFFLICMRYPTIEAWALIVIMASAISYTLIIPDYPLPGLLSGMRKTFLPFIAYFTAALMLLNKRAVLHFTIAATCSYVCAYGVWQAFYFSPFDEALLAAQSADLYTNKIGGIQRSFSLLSSAFHLGLCATLLMCYSLFYTRCPLWHRIGMMFLALPAVYFTYTRSFAAVAIILMLYKFVRISRLRLRIWLLIAITTTSLMLLTDVLPLADVSEILLADDRFTGRGLSYEAFAYYTSEHPLQTFFGFGIGSAGSGLSRFYSEPNIPWIEPHSIYLKYIFELGLIWGLPFMILFARMIYVSIKRSAQFGEGDLIFCAIGTVLISGLTNNTIEAWPVSLYIFMMAGVYYPSIRRGMGVKSLPLRRKVRR